MISLDALPELAGPLLERLVALAESESRIVALTVGGSAVLGTMDRFSDLDLVIVCDDHGHAEMKAGAQRLAEKLGPLLAAFTGEHVGEPALLICLYGPPLLHVDLKFVAERDLAERVEDGVILWQRDGVADAVFGRSVAAWPSPDRQWLEDRFWVWIHYGAAKLGRGELFECLDLLGFLRATVLCPLLAVERGARPQGARRVELFAPDSVPVLAETIAGHDRGQCVRALRDGPCLLRAPGSCCGAPAGPPQLGRTPRDGVPRRAGMNLGSVGGLDDPCLRPRLFRLLNDEDASVASWKLKRLTIGT